MALTTLDGVIAALRPPVAVYTTNSSGNEPRFATSALYNTDSTTGGGITHTTPDTLGNQTALINALKMGPGNAPSGQQAYIANISGRGLHQSGSSYNIAGSTLWICDLLWTTGAQSNGTALSPGTALQTIDSVTWPARDDDGTTNGKGVYIGYFVNGNLTTPSNTATITYTNSAGVSGRTAQIADNQVRAVDGTVIFFGLQSGDLGVRSVQSFQLDTDMGTGTFRLFAFRPIAVFPIYGTRINKVDAVSLCLPKVQDNSVLIPIVSKNGTGFFVGYTYHIAHG